MCAAGSCGRATRLAAAQLPEAVARVCTLVRHAHCARSLCAGHPDKHQGEKAKTRAAKAFRELQRAYQVLGNKAEREVYDSL